MGYTVEEIFTIYKLGKKEVLTLTFAIGSISHSRFGNEITVLIEFSDKDLEKIMTNIRENSISNNFVLNGKVIDNMELIEIDLNDVIKINGYL